MNRQRINASVIGSGSALRVLIADDSREVRRSLVEMIEVLPHVAVIAEAENAATAYRFARDLKPDAVVLDINLPDRSGVWVLRQLQREHVPADVYIFTNHNTEFYRRKCLEAGATAFFDKHTERKLLGVTLARLGQARGASDRSGQDDSDRTFDA